MVRRHTTPRLPGPGHPGKGSARTRSDHRNEIAEDYVEFADLIDATGEARAVDLANRLGVTNATVVAHAISRLQRDGLVHSEPYRSIFLTENGRCLAEHCRRRHRVVYGLLRALGVRDEVARIDTEGIEHHVSEETLQAFEQLLNERSAENGKPQSTKGKGQRGVG